MTEYRYTVKYKQGEATGSVQAETADEAKASAKALYDGLQRDTYDRNGRPVSETINVTEVTVIEVKEGIK